MTTEQIMFAWERLRQRRNRESIARDMKRIIAADKKRTRRFQRNREVMA